MDPFTIGFMIALMVISYAIQASMAPKAPTPTAGQLDVPTPEAGGNIGVLFGTNVIKNSNIIWYGDSRVVAIQKGGGKK